ncbi:hypothetical protein, partial [Streptomyces huiliensis]|uniref:hypothetical protein n=1 Tax=Streptomyces huiliensis TaxID=2876027 RepID=UPI001CC19EA2
MENTGPSFRRRLLLESLAVLAADASAQVAWLAGHGVQADEIALDFDHAYGLAPLLVEEGRLGHGVLPDLREIDAVCAGMTGDDWTREALRTGEGWDRVRHAARRVL